MLKKFLLYVNTHKLFEKPDNILLAVSGGLDSMAMLHLFKEAGFTVGVAHCNFQLRGAESDGDEALVKSTCATLNIPCYVKRFDTETFATENGISIQMAARELRYSFFNDMVTEFNYKYVATAHHLNDNIETVLLNLVRGTGVDGLTGISIKSGTMVRPMLFATREEIKNYADAVQLIWRDDASNASDKYHRNLLRNRVIPLLKQINPGLEDSFESTLERLRGTASLQAQSLENFRKEAVREVENKIFISIQKLLLQPFAAVVLWELIKGKGFNLDQCSTIVGHAHQSGKAFYAGKYSLTVDRSDFIIATRQSIEDIDVRIDEGDPMAIFGTDSLRIEKGDVKSFMLNKAASVGQFDQDLVRFPLCWRKWRAGDSFVPLGMKQRKKISDFLIDIKVPLPDKEQVTVLESGGEIIWVVGFRIDDRFKIKETTERFLLIKHARVGGNDEE